MTHDAREKENFLSLVCSFEDVSAVSNSDRQTGTAETHKIEPGDSTRFDQGG